MTTVTDFFFPRGALDTVTNLGTSSFFFVLSIPLPPRFCLFFSSSPPPVSAVPSSTACTEMAKILHTLYYVVLFNRINISYIDCYYKVYIDIINPLSIYLPSLTFSNSVGKFLSNHCLHFSYSG